MSKGNTTENDYVKFEANAVAMPSYGANLQINLHTADPGEAGTATTNLPTYTNYVAQTVSRDAAGLTICDGTNPYADNASGNAYKNFAQINFPEYEGGFVGTEDITHTSISVIATGQILRKTALTQARVFSAGITPIFPAETMIWAED